MCGLIVKWWPGSYADGKISACISNLELYKYVHEYDACLEDCKMQSCERPRGLG